jgi:aminoglycoside phosphotransferase (APT) family kinase protein
MVSIDASLVSRLIASQFPQWADLPICPVASGGWDNRTFHLGERMVVRLPSAVEYSLQVEKEHRWLPKLAPHLPLPIPVPLAMGIPDHSYSWHWSIYRWLDGEAASTAPITDLEQFARTLARFLNALRKIDATDGPRPGRENFFRGGSLLVYDRETRESIAALKDEIDAGAALAIWEGALATAWNGAAAWFHGDVSPGNLLVEQGRLSAVIDFGTSGVGDPACDLQIAWTLFVGSSRNAFREVMQADAAMWARARGWTLWKALIICAQLPGTTSASDEVRKSWSVLSDVLSDSIG